MQGEPLGNKLVLVLAKAVVNKLSDSLAVVIVKKSWLHCELFEGPVAGRNSPTQAEGKCETLDYTLAKVEVKVLAETHSES